MPETDDSQAERNPRVRDLVDYWRSIFPAKDLLPGRRRFDPVQIPLLLPNIVMWEVVKGGEDFVARRAGRAIEEIYGLDLKGFRTSSVEEGLHEELGLQRFRAVVAERRPDFRRDRPRALFPTAKAAIVDRVILPLAKDGAAVDFIVGGYWRSF